MEKIILDFERFKEASEIQDYLKRVFGFPEYYGKNLDALYDELTSIMEDVDITFAEDDADTCCEAVWFDGGETVDEALVNYRRKVRRVIEDAAEENGHLHL